MNILAGPCTFEEVIRKSRFVAHAAPVSNEAETLAFYERVADPGANHNCWAWKLDHLYRSNDDGEPSGSAGRPILAAIEGRELQQVMVVVTRWFGGIKLGIGGLVRAYGGCAAKCLDRGELITSVPRQDYELRVDFALVSVVHQLLDQFGAEKRDEQFDADGLVMTIRVASSDARRLAEALADASRGAARMRLRTSARPGPG
ncbi:MAG: YigZ family protein [Xanthomonadales bacterium]|nr:YigZ family protein [Xanthomonadales bacterium]